MPRAPSSGLSSLLLMAGLAFATTTTTSFVSAATVPLPSCSASSAAEAFCPPPCRLQMPTANRSTQCLYYLQESHKEEVCGRDVAPERRRDVLHGLRMRHCCEHAVDAALPEDAFHGEAACRRHLEALIEVDRLARRLSCGHADLLTRYDCAQNYSIAHDCKDCKGAYRRWVCSSLVPHYSRSGQRVRPCLSVCEDVEQQCPYLVPDQTIAPGEAAHPTPQYAGEPAFLCLDPNIPETGEQRLKSSRGDEDCCYTHCGSAGRGGHLQRYIEVGSRHRDVLAVCEHCPGQPAAPSSAALPGGAPARTFNKALLLWTAWIAFVQTERLISLLLVMCEYSVRTTMCWFLKERRHSCL
ncbi:unnamed protein product [Phaedon cochleariae]|uniref:Uncharacterized protein n=1 Tax=Phaedon cochleariae TaxID=80249 RepID=A0A9P0GTH1_PHACE|nr:unnamed protein product [Phaedon cochleariae]